MMGWKPLRAALLFALLCKVAGCGGDGPYLPCPISKWCKRVTWGTDKIELSCGPCPPRQACNMIITEACSVADGKCYRFATDCLPSGYLPCRVGRYRSDAFDEICQGPPEPDGGCVISNCMGWGTNASLVCRCEREPCQAGGGFTYGVKGCNTDSGTCYRFKDDCLPYDYEACPGFVGSALHALCSGEDFGSPDADALDAGSRDAPDAADAGVPDAGGWQ